MAVRGTGTTVEINPGSLSCVLLRVGSAVGLDQIAQDFIILHLGNSSGLETAELLWTTCSPLLGCPEG